MIRLITYVFILFLTLVVQQLRAQETQKDKIIMLEQQRIAVQEEQKQLLKAEVKAINKRLENGEISEEQAQQLKEEAAQKRALNIENKVAIIDNQIALLKRGETLEVNTEKDPIFGVHFSREYDRDDEAYYVMFPNKKDSYKRRNNRTRSDFVLAFGLNNAILDGQGLNDAPYETFGSRFAEIGWAWTTRVFENSNSVRFRYGFSFQFNGLNPTDNRYFVDNDGTTELAVYPENLKKAKFRSDNLVIPLYFEFGPSKVTKTEDYVRYSTYKKFKFGIGGFAGVNLSSRQKLKYELDGKKVKDKIKSDFNTSNFVYGLGAYIGKGDTSFYVKYDLNPLFNDTSIEQNNISMGIRFDL